MGSGADSQPAVADGAAGESRTGSAFDPGPPFNPGPPFDLRPPLDPPPALDPRPDPVTWSDAGDETCLQYAADMLAAVCPSGTYRTFPSGPAALRAATGEYGRVRRLSQGFAAVGGNRVDADLCLAVDGGFGLKDEAPAKHGFAVGGDSVDANDDLGDAADHEDASETDPCTGLGDPPEKNDNERAGGESNAPPGIPVVTTSDIENSSAGIFNSDIAARTASNMGSIDSEISLADVSPGNRAMTDGDPTDSETETSSIGIPSAVSLSRKFFKTGLSDSDNLVAESAPSGNGKPVILNEVADTHMFSGLTPIVVYFARICCSQGRSVALRPAKPSTSAETSILAKLISAGGSSTRAGREAFTVNGSVAETLAEGGRPVQENRSEELPEDVVVSESAVAGPAMREDARERPAAEAAASRLATEGPPDGGSLFRYHSEYHDIRTTSGILQVSCN